MKAQCKEGDPRSVVAMSKATKSERQQYATEWTRAIADWALTAAEIKGGTFEEKVSKFLNFFVAGSPPYELVCDCYTVVKNKTYNKLSFNNAFHGIQATVINAMERKVRDDEILQDITVWAAFRCLMRSHIPEEIESSEEKLKGCKKQKGESLERYLQRFQILAKKHPVAEKTVTKILFDHMPHTVQQPLLALPTNANLLKLIANIKNVAYWGHSSTKKTDSLSSKHDDDDTGDPMDIDAICNQLAVNSLAQNSHTPNRVNFDGIRNFATLRATVKQLYHKDAQFSSFLKQLTGRQSNDTRQPPPPQRKNIFEITDDTDDNADLQFPDEPISQDPEAGYFGMISVTDMCASTQTLLPKTGAPLFCPVRLNHKVHVNGFLDGGASISILSPRMAQRTNCTLDPVTIQLQCANKSAMTVTGKTTMPVQVGTAEVDHTFFICPDVGHEVILGQDFHYATGGKPNARKKVFELPHQPAIQCLAVYAYQDAPATTLEQDPSAQPSPPPQASIDFCAHDRLHVLPTCKNNIIYFPAGRSFVLAAHKSMTIILPVKTSQDVPILNSSRLPAGVFAVAAVWATGSPLRITLYNTSNKSVHIGSKTALIGIMTNNCTYTLTSSTGHKTILHQWV